MYDLLNGIRVLEFTVQAPGRVGQHLGDLGAEVIKIEQPPDGDMLRTADQVFPGGPAMYHLEVNRNKKSLALNAKSEEGHGIILELVKRSHAVVAGFRYEAMKRLRLDYGSLKEIKPDLVYCVISGMGMDGPYRDLATHGRAYDAFSGIAPVDWREDGTPFLGQHPDVGTIGGTLYAALAVVSALIKASRTGQGQFIDVAQVDAASTWNSRTLNRWLNGETTILQWPWRDTARYQVYETKDGKFVIFQPQERKFFFNFCKAMGREDLLAYDRGRPADNGDDQEELRQEFARIFKARTQREWVQFLIDANVPGGPVYSMDEMVEDPHFKRRRNLIEVDDPRVGRVVMNSTPVKLPDQTFGLTPAPDAGQHNDDILADVLGYSAGRIAELRGQGVIM